MKQTAAILLILLLAFNWYGYRIVTNILEKNADKQLETQLDKKQYTESQLIEIRVALNVPYQNNQQEFERHYGEVEVEGRYYTYVKRKIENGFLILKCIPNSPKEKIKAADNELFKLAYGLDHNQQDKKQNSSLAKNFWSEYDDQLTKFNFDLYNNPVNTEFLNFVTGLYTTTETAPKPPPNKACLS